MHRACSTILQSVGGTSVDGRKAMGPRRAQGLVHRDMRTKQNVGRVQKAERCQRPRRISEKSVYVVIDFSPRRVSRSQHPKRTKPVSGLAAAST